MRRLAERHRVAVVTRKWGSTARLLRDCPLPVVHCDTIEDVERFLDRQRVRVIFYVNQNQQNFPAMRFADPAHVFVCHGESDKDYMSSNQLKSYDHVFVAGQAARERIRRKLIGFDESHLVEVGRPQVDVHPAGAALPHDGRTVVLYAPTTEGDVPSMRYSSVASHGVALVRSLVADSAYRVIYRPHPRLGLTVPAYRAAHEEVAAASCAMPTPRMPVRSTWPTPPARSAGRSTRPTCASRTSRRSPTTGSPPPSHSS